MNLELTMNKDDVERLLLEWAEREYRGKFNHVNIGNTYSASFVVLTYEKPAATEAAS